MAKWVNWDEMPEGVVKAYTRLFLTAPAAHWIHNAKTQMRVLQVRDGLYFPVTINQTEWDSTFTCSPYTAYVLYAQDEIRRNLKNPLLQVGLLGLLKGVSWILKRGKINQNVHVNNFLLSTNPYPAWSGEELAAITIFLLREFPQHALIFRSLNEGQHADLLHAFQENGYHLVGSRQVYLYEMAREAWLKHNNNKHDLRLMRKQNLRYLPHEAMGAYLEEALVLYQKLYLEKYSRHNPQFSLAFFQACHRDETMVFQGFADAENRLRAFSGLFVIENTITSPLVGYDTDAPQKEGLYIHAIQLVFDYLFKTGKVLNLSSGAAHFKRLRGGKPAIEYSAVYMAHLPWFRRLVYGLLLKISNQIGIPLMKKYEL
ncbi:MAG: hypothetical protein JNN12_06190 [Bacteroidetes Order II. Incertae sedis bacterium]|nr:hypothetical protein [Bacteroidetes Order II. bacterium]